MRNMQQKASSIARERGYVSTMMGRQLRFPGGQFVHKASGLIYQGTSADAMKVKLIEIDRYLTENDAGRLLLTVHDEVGISLEKGADPKLIADIYTCFDGVKCEMKFRVPITCDWGVGTDWYTAKG
jgi:DNA polymerase-1